MLNDPLVVFVMRKVQEDSVANEKLLTVDEVAEDLGVSRITVLRWVRALELPAAKIGKTWRVRRTDLDDWIQSKIGRSPVLTDRGWTPAQSRDARLRLSSFEEDWNAAGMEAYDEL